MWAVALFTLVVGVFIGVVIPIFAYAVSVLPLPSPAMAIVIASLLPNHRQIPPR
ncbi:hypothetical protein HY857_02545 [Candidatus Saccharibacteria bacterium]|nr:hypothetical protein [Candidatus Saccharibacteria bacterium]